MLAVLLFALAVQSETLVSVQVHGNTLTTDDEIVRLAGVSPGSAFEPGLVETATRRLRESGRFERVEVLKRFASISDPTQIVLVIVVDEGPVRIARAGGPDGGVEVVKDRRWNLMFLPVLNAEDGYGLTYGARFAWPGPAGSRSRLSFPITWGGEKRAAVEFDKTGGIGPLSRVSGGAALSSRTNPFYEEDDTRRRVWIRAERDVARSIRLGATAGVQRASFLGTAERFAHAGADAVFDTRRDPVLPRNAMFARAAWEHIASANRLDLDARGYVGVGGQMVLAARALRSDTDRTLPPYVKPLLGGMANLRGFRAGTTAADTLVAASLEIIVPLTSPLSFGRIGTGAFVDAATAYDKGQRLRDQTWRQGVGGTLWFSAAFLRLNVAIAHGRGSSTRVHVGANVSF